MVSSRVIPCLELLNDSFVKTVRFKKPKYIGDPINTCRIFNELEVDEMIVLGIRQSLMKMKIDFEMLEKIASECFIPLAYGGGINSLDDAKKILCIGYEKVILNSCLYEDISLLDLIAREIGSQSVIASIDVKREFFRQSQYQIYSKSGTHKEQGDVLSWAKALQEHGAGEIIINNISNDGTWIGYDIGLIKEIAEKLTIPVIAHGGAGSAKDIEDVINLGKASAAAIGSMVVYQKKGMGVLINYKKDYKFNDFI